MNDSRKKRKKAHPPDQKNRSEGKAFGCLYLAGRKRKQEAGNLYFANLLQAFSKQSSDTIGAYHKDGGRRYAGQDKRDGSQEGNGKPNFSTWAGGSA